MHKVLKYDIEEMDCYYKYTIYGLNIFLANDIKNTIAPTSLFFRSLFYHYPCSAHFGMDIWNMSVNDFFEKEIINYVTSAVNIYNTFSYNEKIRPAVFIPYVSDECFDERLVQYESFALYVSANENRVDKLINMLLVPNQFIDNVKNDSFHVNWLKAVTTIYPLVVLNGHDGEEVTVISHYKKNFNLLNIALLETSEYIMRSNWYQSNEKNLNWDNEYLCLMLR
jgi:hypothetical protein